MEGFKAKMIQSTDMDMNKSLHNGGIHLSLREFYTLLNQLEQKKLLKKQRLDPKLKTFLSPSLKVTDYSLMRDKIIAENLSKDLSLQLGHYVNGQLERQVNLLN